MTEGDIANDATKNSTTDDVTRSATAPAAQRPPTKPETTNDDHKVKTNRKKSQTFAISHTPITEPTTTCNNKHLSAASMGCEMLTGKPEIRNK
ncbi:hypothetical protein ACFSSC_00900 [Corynebacterium mendelii]|uniref:hypothetical protein n=1 Tax=Corynebacterium mendelii TaxID=2765362 RepID=UPI001A90D425|nr:hypothetical protein [Corynebacterium mendelii]